MSILERMRRIVKGNVHDMLDKMESPEKLLKQRIRELEEAIRAAKEATASFAVSLKKMEKEQEQLKRLNAEWEQKAEQALKVGDEAMARRALEEKIKADERSRNLAPAIEKSTATYKQLRDNLVPLQDQLAEAKMKLTELGSRNQAALAQQQFGANMSKISALSGGGGEFEKMEEQVLKAEADVEIQQEIRGDLTGLEDNLAKKVQHLQVDSALDALKKKLGR